MYMVFQIGDEIIKCTARTITKHVHEVSNNSFIGHIGGDDFVAIIQKCDYEKLCRDTIEEFDRLVPNYYNEEDVERGFVEVANRKGIIEEFPVVTISIGVVEVGNENYKTPLEIGEISAQVKHRAKTILGSSYVVNRRRF